MILGMPQAAQGSGYTFQSFFYEGSKKGFPLLSLMQKRENHCAFVFGGKLLIVCGGTDHGDLIKRVVKLIARLPES
ncbi:hypothetical protein ASE74_03540 [Pedobacter sp. Leaf216]|nr:hypothetical protein ASE74_03540 [Pedobacter sp. Leaf216]